MAAETGSKLADAVLQLHDQLRSDRANFETLWTEIARLVIPSQRGFREVLANGVDRERLILDTTAPRSLELFASFLQTMISSPALEWFKMGSPSLRMAGQEPSRSEQVYLDHITKVFYREFLAEQSNLYTNLHNLYLGLGAFGTGCLYLDGDARGQLRSRHYPLENVVFAENHLGDIDLVMRRQYMTPRQVLQVWPNAEIPREKMGPNAAAAGHIKTSQIEIVHAVVPADDPSIEGLPKTPMPFVSMWIMRDNSQVLRVGSFPEMPYIIARWYTNGQEIYGRSPAMTVLPDIRLVNMATGTLLRGAEKLVDPPLMIPEDGLVSPLRLFSGSVTFTNGVVRPEPVIPPGAANPGLGDTLIQKRQENIREGFFVPLFMSPESPVKTATEVLQEADERNRALSPMVFRMQNELFHKLFRRVEGIMRRAGRLPAPPNGITARAEFTNPMSEALTQLKGLGMVRLFEASAPWMQVDETMADNYDTDEIAKLLSKAFGVPPLVMRSRAAIRARREQEITEAQQQQQLERNLASGDVAAKLMTASR